jgi:hypothetical protein
MADLFTYRASTVPMPGLVEVAHHTGNRWVHLYCWPCKTVHEFSLQDVERIVYALGAEAITAYEAGFNDGGENFGEGERTRLPEDPPQCLREVLRGAVDIEVYAEHVEQGIECRERADG